MSVGALFSLTSPSSNAAAGLEGLARPWSGKATAQTAASQADQKATAEDRKLTAACQQFEALFLQQLMKDMRKTVEKTGFLDGGQGEEMFTSLLDQARAEQAAQSGSLGLAQMMKAQLGGERLSRPQAPVKTEPDQAAGQEATQATGHGVFHRTNPYAHIRKGLVLAVVGRVSSLFGQRVHPITGEEKMHQGLDLAAPQGSAVVAAQGGTVEFAGQASGYGNLVILRHADGSQTRYGHLEDITVNQGDSLQIGQKLGTVGQTGLATGPHLHFEYRRADGEPTDPAPLMAGLNLAVA